MPTVSRFSLTPVKSTALHHPSSIRLEGFGAVGDRSFYLAWPDGRFVGGATYGPLVGIVADHDMAAERLALRFPDGSVVEGDAGDLGAPVWTSMWGRALEGRTVEGPFAGALTAFVGRPVRLVRTNEPGAAIDDAPATMASAASVAEFASRAGDPRAADARRFRMLIELDGCEPHEEDLWKGRRVRLGDAEVRVGAAVARCVVTTQDPETGLKDVDTLSVLAGYRGRPDGTHVEFGVYAQVERPGSIRLGDEVAVLDG